MTKKRFLTNQDCVDFARDLSTVLRNDWLGRDCPDGLKTLPTQLYGVPRGGIPAAYLVKDALLHWYQMDSFIVDEPGLADYIIDDLVDSGATRDKFVRAYHKTFYTLVDKAADQIPEWIVFPWEVGLEPDEESATDIPIRLLQYIGEDVEREGLAETPQRFLKAWQEWTSGYGLFPQDVLKVFKDGAEKCDEMVLQRNIPVYSMCEHHMAPFFGVAHVAYIPDGQIVGLSKVNRLVDIFARRLQVQERLTNQIADAMQEHLKPVGVGVLLECRHMCMESRGIQQQGTSTITSALRGAMKDELGARGEFLGLAREKSYV